MIFKLKGILTANSADTVKVFGGEVNILAQMKASDWTSVQPKADESPNRTSCDPNPDDRQERTGCVHVNKCVSCVCVIYVCMCVWKRFVSVTLQEEAAAALCGFFSVPLTYKEKTAET